MLHPLTAAQAGIAHGDWFTITTARGSVRQVAKLTDTVAAKFVQADRWWYPEGTHDTDDVYGMWATNINVRTADDDANCDPVMGAWLLRGLPCRISKLAQA